MLSNAYFLAKFRFDTAENEPAKNLQKQIANFATSATPRCLVRSEKERARRAGDELREAKRAAQGRFQQRRNLLSWI